MAEVWAAAAITIGGGLIAGMGQEKKDKSDKQFQKEQTREEAQLNAQQTGYESALENFYKQKERYETQRGLDQFRQFSTMDQFAPGVNDQGGRVADPTMPDYNSFAPTQPQTPTQGGKSGGKGLWETLDPLGSGIIKGIF